MKTNLSSISKLSIMLFMAFITAALTGCVSEVANENDENGDKNSVVVRDGIVFSDETNSTRTSIGTTGLFYWETGDQIWVDENKDGTFSLRSNDSELATDKRTANFYFRGKSLQNGPYDLTYTGNGSSSGTSVTIKANQSQTAPNDSAHIGTSGDCATATATQQPNGNYRFTLNHKAHYLIFQPYKPDVVTDGWRLMSIEIIDTDGKTLCGTYPFGMGGLDQTRVTGTQSPQVTLTLGGTDGHLLPNKTAWNSSKDSWYAVIAPDINAASRNLKIRYNIKPTNSVNRVAGATFAVIKELTVSSAPNKVTRIRHELDVNARYSPRLHYMWDAIESYWNTIHVNAIPQWFGDKRLGYPVSSTANPQRWYNTVTASNVNTGKATRSCVNLPNANAMYWYATAGDPRWETNYPWYFENNSGSYIYTYGAWFLKKQYISGFDGTKIPYNSGTIDLRKDADQPYLRTQRNESETYKTGGRPADSELDKYFFLPTLGFVYEGELNVAADPTLSVEQISGSYWSSTAVPSTDNIAYYLGFSQIAVGVGYQGANRDYGRVVAPDWFQ